MPLFSQREDNRILSEDVYLNVLDGFSTDEAVIIQSTKNLLLEIVQEFLDANPLMETEDIFPVEFYMYKRNNRLHIGMMLTYTENIAFVYPLLKYSHPHTRHALHLSYLDRFMNLPYLYGKRLIDSGYVSDPDLSLWLSLGNDKGGVLFNAIKQDGQFVYSDKISVSKKSPSLYQSFVCEDKSALGRKDFILPVESEKNKGKWNYQERNEAFAFLLSLFRTGHETFILQEPKIRVKEPIPVDNRIIYELDEVDTIPLLLSGDSIEKGHLYRTIRYPFIALDNDMRGGVVMAEFVVDSLGRVNSSDLKIKMELSPVMDKEVIRSLNVLPNLIPAKKDGVAVNVLYRVWIRFELVDSRGPAFIKIRNSLSDNWIEK